LFARDAAGYPANMARIQGTDNRVELEKRHSRRRKANPENRSEDPEPHHALNNPASDPDPTEFPDPYDRREDPRDPSHVGTPADPDDDEDSPRPNPRAPSTSDPHPPDFDEVKPAKGDEG
jgi:hypothetical protein